MNIVVMIITTVWMTGEHGTDQDRERLGVRIGDDKGNGNDEEVDDGGEVAVSNVIAND
jgi:hypothetical protein